jgi:hypothetical protein
LSPFQLDKLVGLVDPTDPETDGRLADPEAETDSETDSEAETDFDSDSETERDSETDTPSEDESGTETETEAAPSEDEGGVGGSDSKTDSAGSGLWDKPKSFFETEAELLEDEDGQQYKQHWEMSIDVGLPSVTVQSNPSRYVKILVGIVIVNGEKVAVGT